MDDFHRKALELLDPHATAEEADKLLVALSRLKSMSVEKIAEWLSSEEAFTLLSRMPGTGKAAKLSENNRTAAHLRQLT